MNPKFTSRDGLMRALMFAAVAWTVAFAGPAMAGSGPVDNAKGVWFETIERYMDGQWCVPVLLLVGSAK